MTYRSKSHHPVVSTKAVDHSARIHSQQRRCEGHRIEDPKHSYQRRTSIPVRRHSRIYGHKTASDSAEVLVLVPSTRDYGNPQIYVPMPQRCYALDFHGCKHVLTGWYHRNRACVLTVWKINVVGYTKVS